MNQSTAERAVGRWREILPALEVPIGLLSGKNQPCPFDGCGGTDRFRFTDYEKKGMWFCNVCGKGGGIDLLMKYHGWDFKTAATKVDAIVGQIEPPKQREWTDSDKHAAMERLWRSAKPVHPRDPVGRYLINRVGITTFPEALRTALGVKHREGGTHPCMLALLTGPDGKPAMVHRTYLTEDGQKAALIPVKMFMPGKVTPGSAVQMDYGEEIAIAEGLETALSVTKIMGIPCWATCSTQLMMQWKPPAGVKRVVIAADNDANFSGFAAGYTLAHRICDIIKVTVQYPPTFGDFNDQLRGRA